MKSDSQLFMSEASLKEVVASLTALINEKQEDQDGLIWDDDTKLDHFQANLISMLADVAGEMAFKKKLLQDNGSLYFFLFMVQEMANRLNRRNTLQETLEAIVEYVDNEYGPIGSDEGTQTFYEMYRQVSEVAFTNGRESDLMFATKFFFAFVR